MKKITFNLYYLNLPKVYEISMMIKNTILTGISEEKSTSQSIENSLSLNSEGEIGKKD